MRWKCEQRIALGNRERERGSRFFRYCLGASALDASGRRAAACGKRDTAAAAHAGIAVAIALALLLAAPGQAFAADLSAGRNANSSNGGELKPAFATSDPNATGIPHARGSVPLLTIVVGFDGGSDATGAVPYLTDYDWHDTLFERDSGVSHYYSAMSGGLFTFEPAREQYAEPAAHDTVDDGIVHVTLHRPHGMWPQSFWDGTKYESFQKALVAALAKADKAVDFASFDANGNKAIDKDELAVTFVIAGWEAAVDVPDGLPSIWSHAWNFQEGLNREFDGVTLSSYIAIAERLQEWGDDTYQQEPLGLLLHELGHRLVLPDLYSTTSDGARIWEGYTPGETSLMDGSIWATTDYDGADYKPGALDAWCKYVLGWVKPLVVERSGAYTVSSYTSKRGYSVLYIPTTHPGEYYLVENRQFAGYDEGLSVSFDMYDKGGLVIWHVDENIVRANLANNTVNTPDHRPGVVPLYPEWNDDGTYSLKFIGAMPDSSSPFYAKGIWRDLFAGKAKSLDLPFYGEGEDADNPGSRSLTGILLRFLSRAGLDMQVQVDLPETAEDKPADEKGSTIRRATVEDLERATVPGPSKRAGAASSSLPASGSASSNATATPATDDPASTILVQAGWCLAASAIAIIFSRRMRSAA